MRKGAYVAAKVTATTMSLMLQHYGQLGLEVRGVERLTVLGPVCVAGAGQEEQHVGAAAGSCLPTPAACSRAQPCVDVHACVCTYTNLSPSWYFGDGDSSRAMVWVGCAEATVSHRLWKAEEMHWVPSSLHPIPAGSAQGQGGGQLQLRVVLLGRKSSTSEGWRDAMGGCNVHEQLVPHHWLLLAAQGWSHPPRL